MLQAILYRCWLNLRFPRVAKSVASLLPELEDDWEMFRLGASATFNTAGVAKAQQNIVNAAGRFRRRMYSRLARRMLHGKSDRVPPIPREAACEVEHERGGGRDDLPDLRMQERSWDRTTSRMQMCVSSDAAGLKASNTIRVVNHPHP
jgi:hypothetical protein